MHEKHPMAQMLQKHEAFAVRRNSAEENCIATKEENGGRLLTDLSGVTSAWRLKKQCRNLFSVWPGTGLNQGVLFVFVTDW